MKLFSCAFDTLKPYVELALAINADKHDTDSLWSKTFPLTAAELKKK